MWPMCGHFWPCVEGKRKLNLAPRGRGWRPLPDHRNENQKKGKKKKRKKEKAQFDVYGSSYNAFIAQLSSCKEEAEGKAWRVFTEAYCLFLSIPLPYHTPSPVFILLPLLYYFVTLQILVIPLLSIVILLYYSLCLHLCHSVPPCLTSQESSSTARLAAHQPQIPYTFLSEFLFIKTALLTATLLLLFFDWKKTIGIGLWVFSLLLYVCHVN